MSAEEEKKNEKKSHLKLKFVCAITLSLLL
jgi:hypothetical protein